MSFLNGINVLEWGEALTAPLCGKILTDLGADVVKIEPPGGEPGRALPPFKTGPDGVRRSLLFEHLNAGKRSVTIEADDPALDRLAARADVIVEGHLAYDPAVAAALTRLRRENPSLIITSVSAFGRSGPLAQAPGYPSVAFHMSGAGFVTPPQVESVTQPPLSLPGRPAAIIGGYCAAAATVLSLLARGADGRGRYADIAEVEGMIPMLATPLNQYSAEGVIAARDERIHGMSPFDFYRVKDGWASIFLVQEAHWQRLVDLMGSPEWTTAPMFADRRIRGQYKEDLNNIMQPWLDEQAKEDLYVRAQAKDTPIGPARTVSEVLADPHFEARDVFVRAPHPRLGEMLHLRPPFRCRGQTWTPPDPAPEAGEHTARVEKAWPPSPVSEEGTGEVAAASALPLTGLRVIELGAAIASPFGAATLADAGAEVIKIETAKRPDNLRSNWPMAGGEAGPERSYYYNQVNRHAKSLTLDLTTREGRDTFLRLVALSDIVVENFAAGTMERLGVPYEVIRRANPSIVMLSLNGFGDTGPARDFIAYGPLLEAVTGMAGLGGYEGGPPTHSTFVYTDYVSAMVGVTLMLAGLRRRAETGEGAYLNVAQAEVALHTMPEPILDCALNGVLPAKPEDRDPFVAVHGSFRCLGEDEADDSWVAIAVRTDAHFHGLKEAMGRPAWAEDLRFATDEGRRAHASETAERVAQWTRRLPKREAAETLRRHGVPAAAVNHVRDTLEDPHLQARGSLQRVRHPVIGEAWTYPSPLNLEGVPREIRCGAPLWGEHNGYVCRGLLGMTPHEVEDLVERRALV